MKTTNNNQPLSGALRNSSQIVMIFATTQFASNKQQSTTEWCNSMITRGDMIGTSFVILQ
jgi:hypothetical protein